MYTAGPLSLSPRLSPQNGGRREPGTEAKVYWDLIPDRR